MWFMVDAELTGEDGEFQGVQTGFAVPDDELGAGHDLFPADVTRQSVQVAIKFRVLVTSFCTLALHVPDPAVLHQALIADFRILWFYLASYGPRDSSGRSPRWAIP